MSGTMSNERESWSGVIRVRLHGRGGHGIKTAGRVVGTAAFLAGYQAQDAPIYGAERRGAAVASFVRISDRPILERGPIGSPDVLVVADETLLADPTAGVMAGQAAARAIFVNTLDLAALDASFPPAGAQGASTSGASTSEAGVSGLSASGVSVNAERLQGLDLSGRTKAALGRASALSAGLAAAAARLTGVIPVAALVASLREEFAELGVAADLLEKNVELAVAVFEALRPAARNGDERWRSNAASDATSDSPRPRIVELAPDEPRISAPTILQPGNSALRHTGAWRLDRPVPDLSTCSRCGLCFTLCPDGAITLNEQGYPVIDYDHCKGCMICQRLCPIHAIEREPETRAW